MTRSLNVLRASSWLSLEGLLSLPHDQERMRRLSYPEVHCRAWQRPGQGYVPQLDARPGAFKTLTERGLSLEVNKPNDLGSSSGRSPPG